MRGSSQFQESNATAHVDNEKGETVIGSAAGNQVLHYYSGSETSIEVDGAGTLDATLVVTRGTRTTLLTVILDHYGCYSSVVVAPA